MNFWMSLSSRLLSIQGPSMYFPIVYSESKWIWPKLNSHSSGCNAGFTPNWDLFKNNCLIGLVGMQLFVDFPLWWIRMHIVVELRLYVVLEKEIERVLLKGEWCIHQTVRGSRPLFCSWCSIYVDMCMYCTYYYLLILD